MKKYMCLFVLPFLLCGCSSQQLQPEETEQATTESEEIVETIDTESAPLETILEVDLKTTTEYDNFDAFLKSEFCKQMQQEGFTTYALSCDEERFEAKGVTSDARFYRVGFKDAEGEKGVSCTIHYNAHERTASELAGNKWDTSGDSIVTVEKDGVSYEVYISKTPFVDYDEYSISYLPLEGYKMSINAFASTPEEALSYIHEFDLVPVEAASAQTVEIVEEVEYSNTVFFDTEEEFLASPFCERLQEFGYTPHHLSYDTETYELRRIRADASFYEYQLLNKETQEGIGYTVSYYPQVVGLFDMYVGIQVDDRSEDIRTTVEKDGVEYDVYLAKSHYGSEGAYRLLYLPFPHYGVSVEGNSADVALSYLHEFTLVPITEW